MIITLRITLIFTALLMSACNMPSANPTTSPDLQQLRIINSGAEDIEGLVILFPGNTADSQAIEIEFGNVPAGATTEYKSVPSGVYRYSAYKYFGNERLVTQPVIDWVGESPSIGEKFTYRILLDPEQAEGNQIQLVDVAIDAP